MYTVMLTNKTRQQTMVFEFRTYNQVLVLFNLLRDTNENIWFWCKDTIGDKILINQHV